MPRNNRTSKRKKINPPGRHPPPWIWIGALVIVAAIGLFLISRVAGSASSSQISTAQAYGKYQGGSLILDVRTVNEWNQGHIPGSVLIPLEELSNKIGEVPRNRDVVVVCRTGVRSQQGLAILQQAGYTRVASMTGGMDAWQAAGYPVARGNP